MARKHDSPRPDVRVTIPFEKRPGGNVRADLDRLIELARQNPDIGEKIHEQAKRTEDRSE